jgi:glycosyltransferase involved in cell wall biosynthesis
MDPSDEAIGELHSNGIQVEVLGDDYNRSMRRLRRLVADQGVDIVVCCSFKAFVVAKLATVTSRCQVVFWIPAIPFMNTVSKRLPFRALAVRTHLVFISKAVACAHSYPWHQGDTTVLYYGISDQTELETIERSELRTTLDIEPASLVLGYVAEFTPWKDHSTLLQAFEILAERFPTLHLVLVGKGSHLESTKEAAQVMKAAPRIHFLGTRSDVRQLYRQFDVYVHPAVGEGFGIAVAEAMLANRPVVVANAGALPEFVLDDVTGLLFEPHNAPDLSEKIERLLGNDEDLRLRLGQAARQYCLERFDPDTFADQMTSIIEFEARK